MRAGRIELPSHPWQGRVLPLNHTRNYLLTVYRFFCFWKGANYGCLISTNFLWSRLHKEGICQALARRRRSSLRSALLTRPILLNGYPAFVFDPLRARQKYTPQMLRICSVIFCAPGGDRTPNPLVRSQVLYPLSYGRIYYPLAYHLLAKKHKMHYTVLVISH